MSGKRRFGDRKDGKLLRNIDSMHFICPIIYPNRCDNEAYISEKIDMTAMGSYIQKKNAADPEFKYTSFQAIVTAMLKVITLRPKLNRFIVNGNTYQRNDITASFVVKKSFDDSGEEGLAFVKADPEGNIESVHQAIYDQIKLARGGESKDASSESMDMFNKMPRIISKTLVKIIRFLDKFGMVPQSLIASDPYYSSVLLSNLGSIKLHAGYHHLTNWGTLSLFVIVGERKPRPFTDVNGKNEMRDSLDLGLTIDERLADGYYYSRSVALMKKLLENPELLDLPLGQEVDY